MRSPINRVSSHPSIRIEIFCLSTKQEDDQLVLKHLEQTTIIIMDLLASLNLEDLPEQQTRMMEIMKHYPELDARLGFDVCCTCAALLDPATKVTCPVCRRVDYCSEACREKDARVMMTDRVGTSTDDELLEVDPATGHSSIICALLKLCQDDEDVEDKEGGHKLDYQRREAAQYRVRSELESYPATLANVIAEGPCYESVLKQCKTQTNKKLVIHVVGASIDGELWGNDKDLDQVSDAYAEALSDLAEKTGLATIELLLFGPECPSATNLETLKPIRDQDHTKGELIMRTYHGVYNAELLEQNHVTKADIVVFFNPGFTVPDYQWVESLECIPLGTPFLSTTNTEMEGIADCQFLLDQDKIQSIPPGLAEMLGLYSSPDDDGDQDDETMDSPSSFFAVNPFCGMRVRQSGTMANDLFVKNRWMLGGIMNSFDPSRRSSKNDSSKKKRRTDTESDRGNSKAANPALI